jgi:hypothetical protein
VFREAERITRSEMQVVRQLLDYATSRSVTMQRIGLNATLQETAGLLNISARADDARCTIKDRTMSSTRKLIEVALPLEAINVASARAQQPAAQAHQIRATVLCSAPFGAASASSGSAKRPNSSSSTWTAPLVRSIVSRTVRDAPSVGSRRFKPMRLKSLEYSVEAVSLCVCRLGEHWLDIDDRRSINRFYRSHF